MAQLECQKKSQKASGFIVCIDNILIFFFFLKNNMLTIRPCLGSHYIIIEWRQKNHGNKLRRNCADQKLFLSDALKNTLQLLRNLF